MIALHLLAIVVTTATVLLGLWQYDAWQTRRAHAVDDLANVPAKPLDEVMSADDPFPGSSIGRPVRFEGQWLPDDTVFVSGRVLDGQTGTWAVTPVALCAAATDCATAPAMLVVRGFSRDPADVPPPPDGPVRVTGWLQPGEGSGVTDADPTDDVIPQLRIADAIQHVDQDLYGAYVVARDVSTSGDGGLQPVTPGSLPAPETFTGLRNLLYGVEWWVFGGFFLFLWLRWCRDEVSQVSAVAEAEQEERTAEVASRP
jgi:surfeit locus 1 family protein